MKLYKFDYTGAIGDNVVNVPTDSQFLVGVGSAASSTVKLYDGETEIPAEPARVNAYTCFRFDTGPNPSRKGYKAVISGVDEVVVQVPAHSYPLSVESAESVTADVLENDDGKNPWVGDATGLTIRYRSGDEELGRATYHINNTVVSGGRLKVYWYVDDEYAQLEYVAKSVMFWAKDDHKWSVASFDSTNVQTSGATTVPKTTEVPWSKSFDLLVWSRAQSVAYRDAEGITAAEAVEAAKDSGEFLVNDDEGMFSTEDTFLTTNSIVMSGPGPDFESCLELDVDAENAQVNAFGTLNAEELTIVNPALTDGFRDASFDQYTPLTVSVKVDGVEWLVKVFGYVAD